MGKQHRSLATHFPSTTFKTKEIDLQRKAKDEKETKEDLKESKIAFVKIYNREYITFPTKKRKKRHPETPNQTKNR